MEQAREHQRARVVGHGVFARVHGAPLDVLRREHFGAVHYARETAGFQVFPPAWADLLIEAATTGEHIMDTFARNNRGIDPEDFILEVARLQDIGTLDEGWRIRARVVDDVQPNCLSAPLVTNLQVTRSCNLSCAHCFVDVETKRHPDELDLPQLDALFAELSRAGAPLLLLAGGEPMMRPDFWSIVDAVGKNGIDAALCTNATLIDTAKAERLAASPLRWFSISLDGPDAEIHDKLRGTGGFARATRGIRALVAAGARGIKLRVTVTSENIDHLLRFAETARDLEVPEIVFKPFRHTTGGEAFSSTHLYITRERYMAAIARVHEAWPSWAPPAKFDDGMPESLPAWTNVTPEFGCVGGTTHASVIYDGRIVACDAVHDPADWTFHEKSLLEAWRGAPTIRSWRSLEDDECHSCGNFERCGGGCRARALAAGGTMSSPDPWAYCEDHRESPMKSNPLLRVLA